MEQRLRKLFGIVAVCFTLGACASTGNFEPSAPEIDPYEERNRQIFEFNQKVHENFMKPVSTAYNTVVPKTPRKVIRNFLRNLREPWIFINDILQGEFDRAGTTFSRFFVNTTIGLGGTLNMAPNVGLEYHTEDFGQTLAVWGVKDGPYIVLPFLGPSGGRDAVGFGVDFFAEPIDFYLKDQGKSELVWTRTGVKTLEGYARSLDAIDGLFNEEDAYTRMRTLYLQNRAFEIRNGRRDTSEDDLFDDLEDFEDEESNSNPK